ncbi:hypothetical protein N7494_002832 [Penicillium frequentans]|uniref:Alpha-L-rhamnosidase six-hairpin glycosidase domain-containing protein n=1 Tax=Penicillium frequentans TaxID=3151616 RepID=A0AAD6D4M6_9EURO|nr:hypothetical protein N7494_002832 [Penicillium glabrum]
MARHWSELVPWIWTPNWDDMKNVAGIVQFRKTFDLSSIPSECIIHISADTRYRLYVNGQSVCFGPAKSHLGEWNYETIDIAPFCLPGKNVIAARVLRYSPRHSGNMSFIRGIIPGLILHSDNLEISTNETWLSKVDDAVKILAPQKWDPTLGPSLLVVNEEVDGTKETKHWLDVDFDESQWTPAVKSSMKVPMVPILEPRRLVERSIPLLPEIPGRFSQTLARTSLDSDTAERWDLLIRKDYPLQIDANSQVTVVLDTSFLLTAFLNFSLQGGAASKLRIRCAECFEEAPDPEASNPFARKKGDRTDSSGVLIGHDDFYTVDENLGANEGACYEPFWFRTFRYVELQIQTAEMPLQLRGVKFRTTNYPLEIKTQLGNFPSTEMAKQWDISLHTLKNCMHETYEDCPYYEQNQFAMDGRLQILFTYNLSSDDRLARKCMQEFYASRRPDGLIETHFPAPFPVVNIPYFSLYWILMIHDHMMYFGDQKLVRRYLGTIDGILDHFDRRVGENDLVGRLEWDVWPFVDWTPEWSASSGGDFRNMATPPAYHRTGVITYSSLIYAYALQKAADICEYSGRHDTAKEYRQRAECLNHAAMTHCFRTDFLVDGPDSPLEERSQHSQVFAILSGALTGKLAREVLLRALTDPSFVRCSYAMSFYIFEATRITGLYDQLRSELLKPWSAMIRQNLTTWAESAAMPRSDCHGWSAVPIHDLVANVAGLTPGAPGYSAIRFEPRREYWKNMSGTFAVGSGTVVLAWHPEGPVEFTSSFNCRVELCETDGSTTWHEVIRGKTVTFFIS